MKTYFSIIIEAEEMLSWIKLYHKSYFYNIAKTNNIRFIFNKNYSPLI